MRVSTRPTACLWSPSLLASSSALRRVRASILASAPPQAMFTRGVARPATVGAPPAVDLDWFTDADVTAQEFLKTFFMKLRSKLSLR